MPPIKLSIALVTRNRPDWLRKCLGSWRAQSVQPFEIIISDDSSSDYELENEKIASEFECRYVKGPKRGLYANRNNAALSCLGTHIMSADDDHTHPAYFTETILADIAQDSECVWTYGEKHPRRPKAALTPPPELTPDNRIITPADISCSSAIADGSSVYPKAIFDAGLRYDETYPFGILWYLWGQYLARSGFRIRFSSRTFVWHDSDSVSERSENTAWTKLQLECSAYVIIRNAMRDNKSVLGSVRAVKVLIKSLTIKQSPPGVTKGCRLDSVSLIRAIHNAFTSPYKCPKLNTTYSISNTGCASLTS